MPKKICPNGHIYDSSIYGEECPLCPKSGDPINNNYGNVNNQPYQSAGTQVSSPTGNAGMGVPQGNQNFGQEDASGATVLLNKQNNMGGALHHQAPAQPIGGGTVIRQPKGIATPKGRKLVGFLVTYNRNPQGKAYEIYEGKNYVGRENGCDISVPEDNQMSGRHMSILYRNVDNKFKYRDEQSSNGTFVNKELSDEGELQNFDIIRLGNTVFIFIAIPQFG